MFSSHWIATGNVPVYALFIRCYNALVSKQPLSPLQLELRATLEKGGCPLCRLANRDVAAFLESLTYERILDLKTRDALQHSRGLCAQHARAWRKVRGVALSIAIVYQVAVKDLLRDTEPQPASFLRRPPQVSDLADALASRAPCPACALGEQTATRYGDQLVRDLRDPDVQTALEHAGGLCLPHLRLVLARPGPAAGKQRLVAVQRQAWAALLRDLDEFIRKNDYRFQHEPVGEEGDSWLRALDVLVGGAPE